MAKRPSPASPPSRPYRGRSEADRLADRRARLLAAGLDAFGTAGYFGTTVESICSAAGVANRSFYEHFATKEDLLLTIYDQRLAEVASAVTAALASAPPTVEGGVRAGLKAVVYVDAPRLLGRRGHSLRSVRVPLSAGTEARRVRVVSFAGRKKVRHQLRRVSGCRL